MKRYNPKRFGKSAVGGGIRLYPKVESASNETEHFAPFVAPDKGFPSCGSQNSLRLGAPMNFDRCAILASLHPPQAALRRRCPSRSACLRFKFFCTTKKKQPPDGNCFFLAGAEGLEVASQPLLRCPKFAFGLERRRILTAAPSSPRFIRHRRRFGDDARHAPRASGSDTHLHN